MGSYSWLRNKFHEIVTRLSLRWHFRLVSLSSIRFAGVTKGKSVESKLNHIRGDGSEFFKDRVT